MGKMTVYFLYNICVINFIIKTESQDHTVLFTRLPKISTSYAESGTLFSSRDHEKGELLLREQMNRPLAMKKDVIQTRNRKITRSQPKTFTCSPTKMGDEAARDNRICYRAHQPLPSCGSAEPAEASEPGDSSHQQTSFTNNSSNHQPNHGQDFNCDIKTQSDPNDLPPITADGYNNMPTLSSSFHQYMLDNSTSTTATTFNQ